MSSGNCSSTSETEHDVSLTEPSAAERLGKRTDFWAAASLVILSMGLFLPALQYDFVNWDDNVYVIGNPLIRSWHPSNLVDIATQQVARNYAPVTILSYLIDHSLWGLNPGGYHLTNLVLHAINAVLVYVLIVQLCKSRFIGWTTAALFAIHPVQVETVVWISARKGLLSGAFILAALICWLRPERTVRQAGFGLLFFVLALFSKAIAVVVPPIVVLYDLLILREIPAKAIARQVVPGLLAVTLLLITMSTQMSGTGGVRDHWELSILEILAVDSIILWQYLGMLVWPDDLCILYAPDTSGIVLPALAATAAWIGVGIVLYRVRKRCPDILLAAAAFILLLLPVLNLFPITTLMNDRYLYLPCIPIFALAAGGLRYGVLWSDREARSRWPISESVTTFKQRAACLLVCACLSLYIVLARTHIPVWTNSATLWTHAASQVSELPVVRIQFAHTLYLAGRERAAVRVLKTTLTQLDPDRADRRLIGKMLKFLKSPTALQAGGGHRN